MPPDGGPDERGAADYGTRRGARHGRRAAFFSMLLLLVASLVALPFFAVSLIQSLDQPVANHAYDVSPTATLAPDSIRINIEATAISETAQSLTLRLTGQRFCQRTCAEAERIDLFSVRANAKGADGAPPSASITVNGNQSDFDSTLTLPVVGQLIDYPFDSYRLVLGVSAGYIEKNGSLRPLSPLTAERDVAVSFGEEIPRLTISPPLRLSAARYGSGLDEVASVTFFRPLYLRLLTLLLVLAITIAATYGVVLRPFDQVIPTTGVIVLGVWGVRTLLVGSYPADSTAVDLVLTSVIVLLLIGVMAKGVLYLRRRAFPSPAPPSEAGAT